MSKIRFACSECGAAVTVAAEHAGKKGKCPKCSAAVRVPAPAQPASAEPAPEPAAVRPTQGSSSAAEEGDSGGSGGLAARMREEGTRATDEPESLRTGTAAVALALLGWLAVGGTIFAGSTGRPEYVDGLRQATMALMALALAVSAVGLVRRDAVPRCIVGVALSGVYWTLYVVTYFTTPD